MSSRFMRTLLKLYPRRIRKRYGEELLDLQDELSAQGQVSRARLIRDMLAGALLVRNRRTVLAAAVIVIAGLAAAGTMIGGASHAPVRVAVIAAPSHPRARPTARALKATRSQTQSCFVGGGSSCSVRPCTEFIAQAASEVAASAGSVSATASATAPASAKARALVVPGFAPTRCTAYPNVRNHRRVFVNARA